MYLSPFARDCVHSVHPRFVLPLPRCSLPWRALPSAFNPVVGAGAAAAAAAAVVVAVVRSGAGVILRLRRLVRRSVSLSDGEGGVTRRMRCVWVCFLAWGFAWRSAGGGGGGIAVWGVGFVGVFAGGVAVGAGIFCFSVFDSVFCLLSVFDVVGAVRGRSLGARTMNPNPFLPFLFASLSLATAGAV